MCLYQVFYTYLYQLLLSRTGICYPSKLLISDVDITSSYLTTNFIYSYVLPYQIPFSAHTFSLLHLGCSDYPLQSSFQLFTSASPSTPINYSYQLLVIGRRYYSVEDLLLYQLSLLSTSLLGCNFQVLL